jgi:tetratricopeptide (TPR) repeat protein
MLRSLMTMLMAPTLLMIGVAGALANGQQAVAGGPQVAAGRVGSDAEFPDKPELLRRIALYEAAEQSAERTHPGIESMVKIYANLAALYEDVGMYLKSEDVMRREISLLRNGPMNELADVIGHLAVLHVAMGNLGQAERDDFDALRIRESVGDPVGTALTWSDLADVYIKQRHFKQALDYAQRAMAVLGDNPEVDVADRITVRQTVAYALCGLKQCGRAIPMLKDALELEKGSYGEDSLMVGSGYFLLGYAAWKNGDIVDATAWMERGTKRMKVDLGWGHVIYLNAMSEYARFLRERGQMEVAATAEREVRQAQSVVRQAQSVVNARSLTGRSAGLASTGLR